ncbi:metal ABC transporter solute-binding protein, Zn/Mn family [Virgibacillus oceani]
MKFFQRMFILLLLSVLVAGCSAAEESSGNENAELTIYTSVYPIQYAAEQIAGDTAIVKTVFPPGADAHTYEPASRDVIEIAESDAFIYMGGNMEAFSGSIADTLESSDVQLIELGQYQELFAGGSHNTKNGDSKSDGESVVIEGVSDHYHTGDSINLTAKVTEDIDFDHFHWFTLDPDEEEWTVMDGMTSDQFESEAEINGQQIKAVLYGEDHEVAAASEPVTVEIDDHHGDGDHEHEDGHDHGDADHDHEGGHDHGDADHQHEDGHDHGDTDHDHEGGHDHEDADHEHENGHDHGDGDHDHEDGHDHGDTDHDHEGGHDHEDADHEHENGHDHGDGDHDHEGGHDHGDADHEVEHHHADDGEERAHDLHVEIDGLFEHYHTGDSIKLTAKLDAAADYDHLHWFILNPEEEEWEIVEGETSAAFEGKAEIDGQQIKAVFYGEEHEIVTESAPVTIVIDDHEGDQNPHIWIDPLRMVQAAEIIRDDLVKMNPAEEELYNENFEVLKKELIKLDEAYSELLSQKENKSIIVSHAAFGFWEERYDINQIAIQGLSSTDEPSQKQLTDIINQSEEHELDYVLFEQNSSNRLSEVIQNEIGADALILHNLEVLTEEDIEEGKDYISLMEHNLEVLDEATK